MRPTQLLLKVMGESPLAYWTPDKSSERKCKSATFLVEVGW